MRRFLAFIRATVVGGFLVVLPVVLAVLVLIEALEFVRLATDPLVGMLGIEEVVGIEAALLLSILAIVLICFLAGLVLASRIGSMLIGFLERSVLDRVPGYRLIKSLTTSFATVSDKAHFPVAIVNLYGDGTRVLGFIVDEVEGEDYAIFVPNAPTPIAGSVYFVARDRVERLPIAMGAAVNSLMQWGIGSAQLLPRR